MKRLKPDKLHVIAAAGGYNRKSQHTQALHAYSFRHEWGLFLVIAREYDRKAIAGLYTRLMRDEVVGHCVQ